MPKSKKVSNDRSHETEAKRNFDEINELHEGEHNRKLRKELQAKLIQLLKIEIIFLSSLMLLQGVNHIPLLDLTFKLNNWAFGIFINGCLIQTFILIRPICNSLFPGSSKPKKSVGKKK